MTHTLGHLTAEAPKEGAQEDQRCSISSPPPQWLVRSCCHGACLAYCLACCRGHCLLHCSLVTMGLHIFSSFFWQWLHSSFSGSWLASHTCLGGSGGDLPLQVDMSKVDMFRTLGVDLHLGHTLGYRRNASQFKLTQHGVTTL